MTAERLIARLRSLIAEPIPLPGAGATPLRHQILMSLGREDLSLARLAEAHYDAVAILAEEGRQPQPGALYGVWASEVPGRPMVLQHRGESVQLYGEKLFCSGAGLLDRALITVTVPEQRLIDLDLRQDAAKIQFDHSVWKATAFAETRTSKLCLHGATASERDILGAPGWYLERPGFWHGACGPAACWAGGAQGLVDYALRQARSDSHTLAHLGAMHASIWSLHSTLDSAGRAIDQFPTDAARGRILARTVRHLVEEQSSDILRRLARAYGPHPLAADASIATRYQELDLYLRQWHAERDL